MLPDHSPALPYRLGCPVWAVGEWVGRVFTSNAKRHEYLHQYSMAFNCVEGNSTFYGLPSLDSVRRWCDQALPGFQFSLKFPRAISHERQLVNAASETRQFLSILETLFAADHLGTSFLQLPPSFAGAQLPVLAAYLRELPEEFPFAVEVRHEDFYDYSSDELALEELLTRLQMDRVIFDSRPLFSQPPGDEFEAEAQRRKPSFPLRQAVTGRRPMLRFIGRNDVEAVQPWIDEWAPVIAGWIRDGLTPTVFAHTPHDQHAPDLANAIHQAITRSLPDLPPLPKWPGATAAAVKKARQRELF